MTLGAVGLGATVGGDLLQGIASARSAGYSAQVARNNAQIERQNAAHAAAATAVGTENAGLKARSEQGALRAGQAAMGVDVNSGSAADVQVSQRELGLQDVSNVANRGAEAVYGYETQAGAYTAQSKLDQSEVGSDILGGALKATGAGIGELPNVPGGESLLSGNPSVPPSYQWMSSISGAPPGQVASDQDIDYNATIGL